MKTIEIIVTGEGKTSVQTKRFQRGILPRGQPVHRKCLG